MKPKTILPLTLVVFCAGSFGQAHAQPSGAIEQVDTVQQRRAAQQSGQAGAEQETPPELYPGETDDLGPQSIVRLKPLKTWFEAVADIQYFYTDNMFLEETRTNRQETSVLVSTVELALAPTPYELCGGLFAPRVGYRHQWYNFGLEGTELDRFGGVPLDRLDFNAQTVFVEGRYRCCEKWIAEAGVDATRLMTQSDYEEFYKELVPHWGLRRLFPVCETTVLSIGYQGTYRLTRGDSAFNSDRNNRTDQIFLASCTHSLTTKLVAQPYYRFKYTHFTGDVDRDDYLHSVGVALQYFFTPQFSARAFMDYALKESSDRFVSDYRKLDAGAGLNVSFRF